MTDTANRVKKIVAEHLGVEESKVTDNASFIDDLGADSLDTVELVMAFEEEFGCEIPDEAAEKILLSEPITAQEALQMGMISAVFEDNVVRAQTLARAQRLAKLSPVAVRSSKELLRLAMNKHIEAVREREAVAFETAAATPAAKEACAAFLEGRKPNLD